MIFALALVCSILFLLLEFIGFASAVRYPVDLGKFTYKMQRIVICVLDIIFAVSILVVYLVNPNTEITICILLFSQIIVGLVYITILSSLCRKQYFNNIIHEIERLNLDINEDIIDLRRKLFENSEVSCSISDLTKIINHLKNR